MKTFTNKPTKHNHSIESAWRLDLTLEAKMLQKLIRIEGVGRLRRLCWPSVGPLGNYVGIYAENGTGKSTLVAVLRAARDGTAHVLEERRTLGADLEQKVELLVGGKLRKFSHGKWSGPDLPLDLFDTHFVETHVYVGRDIGPEQRQQLYRLAIGEAEVDLARQVEADNREIAEATRSLKNSRGVAAGIAETARLSVEEFLAMSAPPPDADATLKTKIAQLAGLDSAGDLSALTLPEPLSPMPPLNVSALRALLDETAKSVSEEAARKVHQHLADLGSTAESWLQQGVGLASGKQNCPFCDQPLDGSHLSQSMVEFFDKSYEDLKSKIVKGRSRVAEWRLWARSVTESVTANDRAVIAWARLLDVPPSPLTSVVLDQAELVSKLLEELLEQKINALLEPLGNDERVSKLEQIMSELAHSVQPYSYWVDTVRSRCTELRRGRQGTQTLLRGEIQRLQAELLRADRASMIAVEAVKDAEKRLEQAKRTREEHQSALESLGDKRAGGFVKEVNEVLSEFGAAFTVEGLVAKTSLAKVNSDFAVALSEGGKVKASSKKASEPRVDTVLSDGDRRTLALAIFLSSVLRRPELAGRVVVLDDPFTSLDRNRRQMTCAYIQRLGESGAQVIVLSHDEFFLRDALPSVGTELQLRNVVDGVEFAQWSAKEACLDRHILERDRLQRVAAGDVPCDGLDMYEVQGAVRIVLEAYLKQKYPELIRPTEYLATFLERAAQAEVPPLPEEQIRRLRTWTGYSAPAHHGNPISSPPRPSGSELRNFARQVLEFIAS